MGVRSFCLLQVTAETLDAGSLSLHSEGADFCSLTASCRRYPPWCDTVIVARVLRYYHSSSYSCCISISAKHVNKIFPVQGSSTILTPEPVCRICNDLGFVQQLLLVFLLILGLEADLSGLCLPRHQISHIPLLQKSKFWTRIEPTCISTGTSS